jgi:hypothetical protein
MLWWYKKRGEKVILSDEPYLPKVRQLPSLIEREPFKKITCLYPDREIVYPTPQQQDQRGYSALHKFRAAHIPTVSRTLHVHPQACPNDWMTEC